MFQATSIASPEWMRVPQADGRELVFFTGVAVVNFRGTGSTWRRDQVEIFLPGSWQRVDEGVASAALAAIDDLGVATNAGWAIDGTVFSVQPPRIVVDIAVTDLKCGLLRLSFHSVALGTGFQPPP